MIHFSLAFLFPRASKIEAESASYFKENERFFYLLLSAIVFMSALQDMLEGVPAEVMKDKAPYRVLGFAILAICGFVNSITLRKLTLACCAGLSITYFFEFSD